MELPEEQRRDNGPAAVLHGASFGNKPLYYRIVNGRVLTAKHSWMLADALGEPAAIRVDHLASVIALLPPVDRDSTPFVGVSRVPAETVVTISADGAIRPTERIRTLEPIEMGPVDAADELWRLVLRSVERATRGAKHVGVLVGGGIDSSALLGAALEVCDPIGVKVSAIALHHGGEGDDRPHLLALEESTGIQATRLTPTATAKWTLPLLEFAGGPIWAATASTDYALIRRARELGAEVVLTGLGGDEIFGGYPRLLANEFARGNLRAVVNAARLRVPWKTTRAGRVFDYVVRPTLARCLAPKIQRRRRRRLHRNRWAWAGPRVNDFLDAEASHWQREDFDSPIARFHSLSSSAYLAEAVEFSETLAVLAEAEIAHPYLDEDVHGFLSSLSPTMLLHAGRARGLFRLATRGRVPSSVRLRLDKARFTVAQEEIFDALGGPDCLSHLVKLPYSSELGLVDGERFAKIIADFPGRAARDPSMWSAWSAWWPTLSVEGFLRARARLRRA